MTPTHEWSHIDSLSPGVQANLGLIQPQSAVTMGVILLGVIGSLAVLLVAIGVYMKLYYRVLSPGQAALVGHGRGRRVHFRKYWRRPLFTEVELVDLTLRTVWETWDAQQPLRTADRDDATLDVTFNVTLPATQAAVLQAVEALGPAPEPETLAAAFRPAFRTAVETAAKSRTVKEIFADQRAFGTAVQTAVRESLLGYALHSVNVHAVGPMPLAGDATPP